MSILPIIFGHNHGLRLPMKIDVKTRYLLEHSKPEQDRYVFSYTIRIENDGRETVQLISRYWHIRDANEKVQEVEGLGVVGEQPTLEPGESYTYTSGTVIATRNGTMQGHYIMQKLDKSQFTAEIPAFYLAAPNALH